MNFPTLLILLKEKTLYHNNFFVREDNAHFGIMIQSMDYDSREK